MMGLEPASVDAVLLSLHVAALATLATLPLALWTGWLLARRDFPGKTAVSALVHLPLVLPPVVTGYALLVLFSPNGALGQPLQTVFGISLSFRWTGAALAAGVMAFPLMVRALRLAFEAVDPRLENAARTLGAPPFSVFVTVTLPLVAPGLLAATVMGFAKALGEFGATITFVASIPGETRTIPSAIYALLQVPGGEAEAARLAVAATALAIVAVALSEWLSRRAARRIAVQ